MDNNRKINLMQTGVIEVEFKHRLGEYIKYTKDVLPLLMSDAEVLHIVDLDTGELLK